MRYDPDMDDSIPDAFTLKSQAAIQRWKRQVFSRAEAILADLGDSRYDRDLKRAVRPIRNAAANEQDITRVQRELVNTLYNLRNGDRMYNHAPSLHPPMTTGPEGHEHDHAAGDDPGAHDGMHRHPHVHEMDNDHDTDVHRAGGGERAGKYSGPGQGVRPGLDQSSSYGAELSGRMGPAQRAASRRARIEDLDRRRGGSV
jgi:hypothetical protein